MLNPFRKPQTDDERRSLWQRVTQPSTRERVEAEQVLQRARSFLEWDAMPYAELFRKWLLSQAHQAVPIGDSLSMVAAATRSNVFREILQHLQDESKRAAMALGDDE